jgi:WD40 repeat protein/predicted Ser/Thr protein kinase
MSSVECPGPEVLSAFVLGELAEPESDRVARHLVTCPQCEEQAGRLGGPVTPGEATEVIGPEGPGPSVALTGQWGDFRIVREIARGGMGVVYEAYQGSLGRHVALKLLPERGNLARFRREARAAGRLHHTNIVPVFGVGEQDGRHFYIMQYIDGRGLDAWPGRKSRGEAAIDYREAARIGVQAAEALAYAHEHGVVHRDIKPSNLLLDAAGTVWITDFGLAKDATDDVTLTHTGDLLGTLRYMAPERFGGLGDARTDIYGLGITLYELACGKPAYDEADRAVLLNRLMNHDPPRPRQLDPAIPQDLETIVLKAMARDPSQRYATAAEMTEDLRRFLDDRPIRARRAALWERTARWCRRNPVVAGLIAALVVVFLAGFAGVTVQWRRAYNEARRADREAQRARDEKALSDHRWYLAEMQLARTALQDDQLAAMQLHLDALEPKSPGDADLRGFDWYYLRRLGHAELLTLSVPRGTIYGVAISPDGRLLAAAATGEVRVWDLATGSERAVLAGLAGEVRSVAFSPDSRRVVTASDDRIIRVWDLEAMRVVLTLPGHTAQVRCVVFSPDGRRIASASGSMDRTVRIWDAASGRLVRSFEGESAGFSGVAFSPDGRLVAGANTDTRVWVWDLASGRPPRVLRGHTNQVTTVAFSPDGRRLASAGADKVVKIWDVETGRELKNLQGHRALIYRVAFSPDGRRVASASDDMTAKVWDIEADRPPVALRGHGSAVHGVAFSPDGRLIASAGADRTVRLWDASTDPDSLSGVLTLSRSGSNLQGAAFSPDGRLIASVGDDRTVRLWDAETGLRRRTLRGHVDNVWGVAFSPDGRRIVTGSFDRTARLWDVETGDVILTFFPHDAESAPVPLSPYGRRIAEIWVVAFSPDGRLIASGGSDRLVRVWDAGTGREVNRLVGHTDVIVGVAFSPDGRRIASCGWDGTVRLWDAHTGAGSILSRGPAAGLGRLAFSPDGRFLAAGSWDNTVKVWDVLAGDLVRTLKGHIRPVVGAAFSPDGRRIASASWDHTVKVWDAEVGQELLTLTGHESEVGAGIAFSPDGLRIVSAAWDGRVKIWEATPMTTEARGLSQARGLVRGLLDQRLTIAEVTDRIRRDASLQDSVRRQALSLAEPLWRERLLASAEYQIEELYRKGLLREEVREGLHKDTTLSEDLRRTALDLVDQIPEHARHLDQASWAVVLRPDADATAYDRALRQAEAACRVMPDHGPYLSTLGASRYRAGDDAGALAVLERAVAINRAAQGGSPLPRDLAFLALARHRLGRDDEARAALAQLREVLKSEQYAKDKEAEALLREAEWIERDHEFPPDPFAM